MAFRYNIIFYFQIITFNYCQTTEITKSLIALLLCSFLLKSHFAIIINTFSSYRTIDTILIRFFHYCINCSFLTLLFTIKSLNLVTIINNFITTNTTIILLTIISSTYIKCKVNLTIIKPCSLISINQTLFKTNLMFLLINSLMIIIIISRSRIRRRLLLHIISGNRSSGWRLSCHIFIRHRDI